MKKFLLGGLIILIFNGCDKYFPFQFPSIDEEIPILKKVSVCHNGGIIQTPKLAAITYAIQGDAVDLDGDGYFNKKNTCSPNIDCDDNRSTIFTGAPEICSNNLDDNCNGKLMKIVFPVLRFAIRFGCLKIWMLLPTGMEIPYPKLLTISHGLL